jgi:hypothetical protein
VNQEGAAESAGPLRFAGLKISINGSAVEGVARGSVSGRYVMFYVPGRGGYFFSTDAPAGRAFLKAGSIDRTRLQFTVDNDSYECTADAPILPDAQSGEVWVYHDPAYKPAGNWTQDLRSGEPPRPAAEEVFAAASDSLSWWIP